MFDPFVLAAYAFLAIVRWLGLPPLLRLATHRGRDWFFDVELRDDLAVRDRFVCDYRRAMFATSIAFELAALADLVVFRAWSHILYVQMPLLLGVGVARRIVLRKYVLTARERRVPASGERVAFSLVPRRLVDYTSRTFELCNAAIALASLAVIDRAGRSPMFLVAFLVLYLHAGLLLWKARLVRQRVVLPADRADEYLELVDEAFRAGMRTFDGARSVVTFFLLMLAVRATYWDAWRERTQTITAIAIPVLMVAWLVVMTTRGRRVTATLLARAREFRPPAIPRFTPDPARLGLAGFVYWNADDPAVVVDGGPLRLSINVANRYTYVYLAYWIVLALQVRALAGAL
ncbi:MAG: hypothetical protein JO197_02705 [Acidobacteria bacterium]|nr:hypothetical protein [Acidobacteriota bacterium]MBV9476709.1 hypothetical protein [Acidobacteriota bacterium]